MRQKRQTILVIVSGMVACLLMQLIFFRRVAPGMDPDAPRYIFSAQSLLRLDLHHFIHFHYYPLFPAVIALFMPFSSSPENAARAAVIIIDMLTVIPVYLLTRRLFNRKAAIAAALIFPFKYFYIPGDLAAEPMMNLMICSAMALGWSAIKEQRLKPVLFTGMIFGLGNLTKSEAESFFLLWFLLMIIYFILVRVPWRKIVWAGLSLWLGYLLIVSPFLMDFYHQTGVLTLNPKLRALFIIHNDPDWGIASYGLHSDESGLYTLYQRAVAEGDYQPPRIDLYNYIKENSGRLPGLYLNRLGFTFKSIIPAYLQILLAQSAPVALIIILIGLIRPGWNMENLRENLWPRFYLLCFTLLPVFFVPLFQPQMRFFSSLAPPLVIMLASGAARLHDFIMRPINRYLREENINRAASIILSFLIIALIVPDIYVLFHLPREIKFHQMVEDRRIPAKWIAEHLKPNRKFMSSVTYMPLWYLNGLLPERDVYLPLAPLPEVLALARQEDVEYLVLDNEDVENRYPDLASLVFSQFEHPELETVFSTSTLHGRTYVIYRIKPAAPQED